MEPREPGYLRNLVRELCALPAETEWVEFKVGVTDPEAIGERISALANGAALQFEKTAFLIWGIRDHAINRTMLLELRFLPKKLRKAINNLSRGFVKLSVSI